jgi:hypothetical protein
VLGGDIDLFVEALLARERAEQLAADGDSPDGNGRGRQN